MAQTYEVGLRYTGGDAASRALRDADAIDSAMNKLERRRGGAALFKGADWSKTAQMAAKAEDAQRTSQLRMEAEAMRSAERIASQQERQASRQAAAAARASAASMRAAEKERTAQLRLDAEAMRSAKRLEDEKRNAAFRRLQAQQREEERFIRYRINLLRKENAERQRIENRAAAAKTARMENISGKVTGGAIAAGAAGVGGLMAGGAYILKEQFDTAKQVEQARMRMTALLGSREAADREIKDLVRAAAKTAFDWDALVDASSSLAASFGDAKERRYVLASLTDMVSVAGGGKQQLDQVVLAINQVVGKGKLEAEELNQLIEPLKGVVSRKEFYLEVAKLMNVSGKDEQAIIDKMQKMQKAGEIGSTVAVQAVTTVGRRKAGSEKAGDYAVQSGGTIAGRISNIKTGFSTLFAMTDSEKWPAFEAFRGILSDIANFFDVDSKSGENFMESLKNAFYDITPQIEWFRGQLNRFLNNPKAIDLMVKGVVGLGQAFFYAGLVVSMAVAGIVMGIGLIKDAFTWVVDGASNLIDSIIEVVRGSIDKMFQLGSDIGNGIANGIKSAKDAVVGAVKGTANSVLDTAASVLDIHSPSRKMMELGQYTGEGFALGIDQSSRSVTDASMSLTDAIATGGVRGGGAGNPDGGVKVYISLPLQTTGNDPAQIAREVGPLLGAEIEMRLDRYFGRLVAQGV